VEVFFTSLVVLTAGVIACWAGYVVYALVRGQN